MSALTAGEVGSPRPVCLWQGDTLTHLPNLLPSRESLLALTRPITEATWNQCRLDPAVVLLLLRQPQAEILRADTVLTHLGEPSLADSCRNLLIEPATCFLDVTHPEMLPWSRGLVRLAEVAAQRAEATLGRVDPVQAWIAGLLAPLGWLAVAARSPTLALACWNDPAHRDHPHDTQRRHWGQDQDSLARRVGRERGLPSWLQALLGRLRLIPDLAADLGARRSLFEVIQGAALQVAREGYDFGLVERSSETVPAAERAGGGWLPASHPADEPLLPELLRLASENRRLTRQASGARDLAEENDRLHLALTQRLADEEQHHRTERLKALAELAAGAGHEINTPLAVISGRAQYLMAHREDWCYPESCPEVQQSLDIIVSQTRRIHTLLRQLMLFARPPAPQRRPVDLCALMQAVEASLRELAAARPVRLEVLHQEPPVRPLVDLEQLKMALTALVRNAIEAAPDEGWVRVYVRIQSPAHPVEVVVEDSGPGPLPEQVPFLFDPFYSGRNAGRGQGLGLPVAWQLVRQQGGELRYTRAEGTTRFVIWLPAGGEPARASPASGGEAA